MSEILANVTCVAVGGRGVLIDGPPGSGKSSLALALIDRGAVLVGDDGVTLATSNGRLVASPPPRIAGKLEIRNVGLVDVPSTSATLALAVRLDPASPRHIEQPEILALSGCAIPLVRLWPETPMLAVRCEWAVSLYGIA